MKVGDKVIRKFDNKLVTIIDIRTDSGGIVYKVNCNSVLFPFYRKDRIVPNNKFFRKLYGIEK